ncbi:MAG: SRPBCC family protein [Mycobacterium leprae]
MGIEESRVMAAPAERVFDIVSDVSRLPQWVPGARSADEVEPLVVRLDPHPGSEAEGGDVLFRAERDQLRVEWGSRGSEEYAGWLQVYSRDDGRSEVNLHLPFLDELDSAYQGERLKRVEAQMRDALDRLAELVAAS